MNSYNFPTKDFNKRQNPVKLTRREVLTIDYSPAPSLLAWLGASAIHLLFANLVVGLSIRNSISVIIRIRILHMHVVSCQHVFLGKSSSHVIE